MDDRGYLWVDDAQGLHPYQTGNAWQLSPIPEESALAAPLMAKMRDRQRKQEESAEQARMDAEIAKIAKIAKYEDDEAEAREMEARRAAITAGDYIMISDTLARIVSRDDKRMRIIRYTPHLDQWGKEQTLAKSWGWRIPTPEEIVNRLNYRALAEAHSRDEVREYRLREMQRLNAAAAEAEAFAQREAKVRRTAHQGPMA